MEKAEVNQPLFIFLFDSCASKHLILAQKCSWCFLDGISQLTCNNSDMASYKYWDTALIENSAS